ncbi:MAG: hypothetical protein ACTSU6_04410 [Candidatus Njordarchaeales archaeon]
MSSKLNNLSKLEQLPVRKRKGLGGSPRYHLKNTDYYLSKRIRWNALASEICSAWEWYKFDGCGYKFVATAEDFLGDPNCPIEILFNMDIIRRI